MDAYYMFENKCLTVNIFFLFNIISRNALKIRKLMKNYKFVLMLVMKVWINFCLYLKQLDQYINNSECLNCTGNCINCKLNQDDN